MFLGLWHEMKKKPKNLIYLVILEPKYIHWLWKAYLSILEVDADKVTWGTRSGVQQEAAHPGAVHTAPKVPHVAPYPFPGAPRCL